MAYSILVVVKERYGSYRCRFPNGITASSTNSAQVAVERLMDKVWKPGTHRATPTGREIGPGLTEFSIELIEDDFAHEGAPR